MTTGKVSLPLINAFKRLVDLLDTEQDMPILAPVIQCEITYQLLVGEVRTNMNSNFWTTKGDGPTPGSLHSSLAYVGIGRRLWI
jgi:hypothetical protein